MQFYAAIALTVALGGRWGLTVVPVACLIVTVTRIVYGEHESIVTWFRLDEILAGGCVALALNSPQIVKTIGKLPSVTTFVLVPLLLASSHPASGPLNYARPYFAAILVGSTIFRSEDFFQRLLCGATLGYLARISYALYVIHPLTYSGWLGQGDIAVRYTKRVGSFLLSFLFAHFSTNYYERPWIQLGHRIAARLDGRSLRINTLPSSENLRVR
jgi:peptidoglycan/LPS O-acetylase OafA/YrhL